MRCLILWADNSSPNLGVRVLARGTAELTRAALGPDVEIEFQDFAAGDSPIAFSPSMFLKDVGRPSGPMKRRLQGFDLVVDTGAGDSFTDGYGAKRLILMHHVRRQLHRRRIPVVMGPQTIGPFTTPWGRFVGSQTMNRSAAVIARETMSAEYARPLTRRDVPSTTDVVFALPVETPATRRDVIVNVSGLLWTDDRFGSRDAYRELVRSLTRGLLDAGVGVTFLAHVLDNPSPDNDLLALADLRPEFGDRVDVVVPTSLDEARNVIAGGDLVIGSRMHACLNAISQGVPTLPLAYSRKFAPLFDELDWHHGMKVADAVAAPRAVLSEALSLREGGREAAEASASLGRSRLALASAALEAAFAGVTARG
jgi:colanic acid/amylovoran biosynthesis protein